MTTVTLMWADAADTTLPLPTYQTAGAAGADLCANFPVAMRDGVTLAPGARAAVPTGLRMAIPAGFEVQIRPRSGTALRHGLGMVNAPGTIDSDYRGEVAVLLVNHGQAPVHIAHGDRIAQMVVAPVVQARFTIADRLPDTVRGTGGFGSTGGAGC